MCHSAGLRELKRYKDGVYRASKKFLTIGPKYARTFIVDTKIPVGVWVQAVDIHKQLQKDDWKRDCTPHFHVESADLNHLHAFRAVFVFDVIRVRTISMGGVPKRCPGWRWLFIPTKKMLESCFVPIAPVQAPVEIKP